MYNINIRLLICIHVYTDDEDHWTHGYIFSSDFSTNQWNQFVSKTIDDKKNTQASDFISQQSSCLTLITRPVYAVASLISKFSLVGVVLGQGYQPDSRTNDQKGSRCESSAAQTLWLMWSSKTYSIKDTLYQNIYLLS